MSWGDGVLAHALAVRGDREAALELIRALEHDAEHRPTSALGIATAYVGLGDQDRAFEWLEQAWRSRERRIRYLPVDPLYDPLKGDPRFRSLLERMELPVVTN